MGGRGEWIGGGGRAGLRVEMGAEGILSGGKAQRRERALQTGTQNPGQSGLGTGENRISGSETHQHGSIRVGGDDCGDGGWVVPPPPVGEGRTVHHRPPGHHGRGWGAKWHPKRRWRWVCGSGVRGSGDTEGKHVVGGGGGGELSIPASRGSADPRRIEWQRGGREDGWVRDPRAVETER